MFNMHFFRRMDYKRFSLVIVCFIERCFMISKKQEVTKETFLLITSMQNYLVNVFFELEMKSMWIYIIFWCINFNFCQSVKGSLKLIDC